MADKKKLKSKVSSSIPNIGILCKVSNGKVPSSLGHDPSDLDMTVDWSRNVTIASTSTIAAVVSKSICNNNNGKIDKSECIELFKKLQGMKQEKIV